MRSPKNIVRHEWICLDVVVVDARNKNLIGIQGEIIDETKKTFIINTVQGEKKVLKIGASFKLFLHTQEIIVKGDIMVGRPEDRIKK